MRNLLLSAAILLGAAHEAHAFTEWNKPVRFGLTGIARGETMQVSVVNTGSSTCNVTLRMLDADGDVIAAQTHAIAPGDQAALSIAGDDVVPSGAVRALVRPKVTAANDPNADQPDMCMASVSTHGAAGTTRASGGFERLQSTRAITPVVTPSTSQRAQIILANTGTGTCQATLTFRAPGNRTLATRSVTLAGGDVTVLDIAGTGAPLWGHVRLTEDPSTPGWPPDPCFVSYGVYDWQKGATAAGGALTAVMP